MYESNRESVKESEAVFVNDKWEDTPTPTQIESEYRGIVDLFPALHKYKTAHSKENLQKLCVEIADFCRAVYSSTQNEAERNIYYNMLDKLNKK